MRSKLPHDVDMVLVSEDNLEFRKVLQTPVDVAVDDAMNALLKHFTLSQIRPTEVAILAAEVLRLGVAGKRIMGREE